MLYGYKCIFICSIQMVSDLRVFTLYEYVICGSSSLFYHGRRVFGAIRKKTRYVEGSFH